MTSPEREKQQRRRDNINMLIAAALLLAIGYLYSLAIQEQRKQAAAELKREQELVNVAVRVSDIGERLRWEAAARARKAVHP